MSQPHDNTKDTAHEYRGRESTRGHRSWPTELGGQWLEEDAKRIEAAKHQHLGQEGSDNYDIAIKKSWFGTSNILKFGIRQDKPPP